MECRTRCVQRIRRRARRKQFPALVRSACTRCIRCLHSMQIDARSRSDLTLNAAAVLALCRNLLAGHDHRHCSFDEHDFATQCGEGRFRSWTRSDSRGRGRTLLLARSLVRSAISPVRSRCACVRGHAGTYRLEGHTGREGLKYTLRPKTNLPADGASAPGPGHPFALQALRCAWIRTTVVHSHSLTLSLLPLASFFFQAPTTLIRSMARVPRSACPRSFNGRAWTVCPGPEITTPRPPVDRPATPCRDEDPASRPAKPYQV